MQFVIPRLKRDQIKTTKDWCFNLFHESRNASMGAYFNIPGKFYWGASEQSTPVTLPEGCVLTVDRYYIRANNEQFDSVTFVVHEIAGQKLKKKLRFWVKLDEVVLMEFDYI